VVSTFTLNTFMFWTTQSKLQRNWSSKIKYTMPYYKGRKAKSKDNFRLHKSYVGRNEKGGRYKRHEPSLICTKLVFIVQCDPFNMAAPWHNATNNNDHWCYFYGQMVWNLLKNDGSILRKLCELRESLKMDKKFQRERTNGIDNGGYGRTLAV
jgi:hypothetical protein